MIDQTFLFPFCWGARSLPLSHLWVCWAGYGYFWFMFDNLWIGIFSVEFPLIPDSWSSQPPNSSDISEYIDYIHPKLHSCEFETNSKPWWYLSWAIKSLLQTQENCSQKNWAGLWTWTTDLDCEHGPLEEDMPLFVEVIPFKVPCQYFLEVPRSGSWEASDESAVKRRLLSHSKKRCFW